MTPNWDDGDGGCHWDGYHRRGSRPGCVLCDPKREEPAQASPVATEQLCTCTLHHPTPDGGYRDEPCAEVATHRLKHDELSATAYLCKRHARALRDMYEPGQIRKLRVTPHKSNEQEKKA